MDPLTVSLLVTDNDGADSDKAKHDVTVANRPPATPTIKGNGSTAAIVSNGTITVSFTSNATDPDLCSGSDEALSYEWDFGDSSPVSTSASPSHTFTSGGTYDVTLTITDGSGESRTSSNEISVSINGLPTSAFVLADKTIRAGATLTSPSWITNNSSDPEGDPLTYAWTFQNVTNPSGGTSTAATPSPVKFTHNVGGGDTFTGPVDYSVTPRCDRLTRWHRDLYPARDCPRRSVSLAISAGPVVGCDSSSWGICNDCYVQHFHWNLCFPMPVDYQIQSDRRLWVELLLGDQRTTTESG